MLLLQMPDGGVIYLPHPWHAAGLEHDDSICGIEDQKVFDIVDAAVGSRGVVE
jgi:hypothetical protein